MVPPGAELRAFGRSGHLALLQIARDWRELLSAPTLALLSTVLPTISVSTIQWLQHDRVSHI
jgi:hypothetical protein